MCKTHRILNSSKENFPVNAGLTSSHQNWTCSKKYISGEKSVKKVSPVIWANKNLHGKSWMYTALSWSKQIISYQHQNLMPSVRWVWENCFLLQGLNDLQSLTDQWITITVHLWSKKKVTDNLTMPSKGNNRLKQTELTNFSIWGELSF